jgi:heat-inducible transcriptional repressor
VLNIVGDMARTAELSPRKQAILRALVQAYIRTGEPIASEGLASASGLAVSSATIRNELAALEEMGYLAQPHTSAGRVPTDLAYRQYVNLLPVRTRLRDPERRAIVHFFDEALEDVDEILRGTTQLLSRLTRYASLALAPSARESAIVRSELIGLGSATLLLIVFDTGRVEKRMIDLPAGTTEDDIEEFSREMTSAFRGSPLTEAKKEAAHRARTAPQPIRAVFSRVAHALGSIDEASESEHVLVGGAANIAAEEAFRQRETLRQIFEELERESEFLRLLREAADSPRVTVTIGQEDPVTGLWEASVIAAPYGVGGGPVGTIGVVGPTRMDYGAAISAVRAVAERLSAAVEALGH